MSGFDEHSPSDLGITFEDHSSYTHFSCLLKTQNLGHHSTHIIAKSFGVKEAPEL